MLSQAMGSGDERTQEAACINHKPSLLGVKQRGRNIAGLTSPCRLQISTYKKKNSGILQLKCQSWEGGGQHGHGSFTGIAGAVVPSVLTFPLSVPIVSAVMALRIPKAQLFALFCLASLQSTCFSPVWKISAKRTANGLNFS